MYKSEAERRAVEALNELRREDGLGPLPPKRLRKPRMVQISEEGWEGLLSVGSELGYGSGGRGGNKTKNGVSVSDMLEALGHGLLRLRV